MGHPLKSNILDCNINQLNYRSYSPDDLDSIVVLERRAFTIGPYSRRMLQRLFKMKGSFNLVVEDGGRVIGYVAAIPLGEGSADIESLAVDPDYHRMGIGTVLMEKIEEVLTENGISMSILEVRDKNIEAIEFYRKLGYETIDHLPTYYQEIYRGSRGAYRMGKILK